MMARLDEYSNDPAIMLLTRCGAFALELFSTHPVDKRGRCMAQLPPFAWSGAEAAVSVAEGGD
jgi:hypothetical protein